MNKRMRELHALIVSKTAEAQGLMSGETKDLDKATALMDEVDAFQKEYDLEERVMKAGKAAVPTDVTPKGGVDGFALMTKMATRQALTETEKTALISGTDATSGENYLIPEDVRAEINELRKTYISAKSLVTVETTTSLSGSVNYEDGVPTGLTNFDDGDAIAEEDGIKFVQKKFNIAHFMTFYNIL
jgi:HK97 family phage major capsid protein